MICVPIAKKIGLSSILGYLFSGIIIGPFVLGFIGSEGQDLMHFAEFGVVMMLFLISWNWIRINSGRCDGLF